MFRCVIPCSVREIERKVGVGKNSGNPYDFQVLHVLDADFNKLDCNLSDDFQGREELAVGNSIELMVEVRNYGGRFSDMSALGARSAPAQTTAGKGG